MINARIDRDPTPELDSEGMYKTPMPDGLQLSVSGGLRGAFDTYWDSAESFQTWKGSKRIKVYGCWDVATGECLEEHADVLDALPDLIDADGNVTRPDCHADGHLLAGQAPRKCKG